MQDTIILIAIITLLNMCCFLMGARIRQKVDKGQDIRMPRPIDTIKEFTESLEAKKEQERDRIIAENIDNYDGTSIGQKDIPK